MKSDQRDWPAGSNAKEELRDQIANLRLDRLSTALQRTCALHSYPAMLLDSDRRLTCRRDRGQTQAKPCWAQQCFQKQDPVRRRLHGMSYDCCTQTASRSAQRRPEESVHADDCCSLVECQQDACPFPQLIEGRRCPAEGVQDSSSRLWNPGIGGWYRLFTCKAGQFDIAHSERWYGQRCKSARPLA